MDFFDQIRLAGARRNSERERHKENLRLLTCKEVWEVRLRHLWWAIEARLMHLQKFRGEYRKEIARLAQEKRKQQRRNG